jgi:hypothetical protein
MTNVLVIHNSDEVKNCFTGTHNEILDKLKKSEYWEDIVDRCTSCNEEDITMYDIIALHHDGDSEDGYILFIDK